MTKMTTGNSNSRRPAAGKPEGAADAEAKAKADAEAKAKADAEAKAKADKQSGPKRLFAVKWDLHHNGQLFTPDSKGVSLTEDEFELLAPTGVLDGEWKGSDA